MPDPLRVDGREWRISRSLLQIVARPSLTVTGAGLAPGESVVARPASVVAARDEEIERLRKLISDTDGETNDAIEERDEAREDAERTKRLLARSESQVAALTEEVERLRGEGQRLFDAAVERKSYLLDAEAEVARLTARVEEQDAEIRDLSQHIDTSDFEAENEVKEARAEGARQEGKRMEDALMVNGRVAAAVRATEVMPHCTVPRASVSLGAAADLADEMIRAALAAVLSGEGASDGPA